jgi:hypothetical protein
MNKKQALALLDNLQEHLSSAYDAVERGQTEGVYVPLLAIRQKASDGVMRYNKSREVA